MTFNLKKLTQYLPTPELRLSLTFCFKYRRLRESIYLLFIRHKVNKNVHWLLQSRKNRDNNKDDDFYKCWQNGWWSTDLYYMSRDV
jgi:hypothetical protein